jgi:hypothetical protein
MVKQLVILGDSFCHGVGTVSPFKTSENTQYAFGKYIAEELNLEYVNLAEPGTSITRAIEVGYNYLSNNKDNVSLVIIGWTHPSRIGFYSDTAMLQILPQYVLLGNSADDDVFVSTDANVKFITDKTNQTHLPVLPQIHKIMIGNNFLESQLSVSQALVVCFKSWMSENNIKYYDFNVFPGGVTGSKCSVTFEDIMEPTRHPTKEEQHQFANLLLSKINE